jgi:3-keto-5-aminohexanoate cleavage enzyme
MLDHGVRPTLECFDLGHVYASHILIKEGLLQEPYHYGLVLNVPGAAKYEPDVMEFMVRKLPMGAFFTAFGIGGKANVDSIYATIALGGHVRVGFEDNIYYSKGRLAASNAELVARAARIAKDCGREVARPDDVRQMLKLRKA